MNQDTLSIISEYLDNKDIIRFCNSNKEYNILRYSLTRKVKCLSSVLSKYTTQITHLTLNIDSYIESLYYLCSLKYLSINDTPIPCGNINGDTYIPYFDTYVLCENINFEFIYSLPDSLHTLILNGSFNQPIQYLPKHLKTLILGEQFNQHSKYIEIPKELIRFECHGIIMLEDGKIDVVPLTLKTLYINKIVYDDGDLYLTDTYDTIPYVQIYQYDKTTGCKQLLKKENTNNI